MRPSPGPFRRIRPPVAGQFALCVASNGPVRIACFKVRARVWRKQWCRRSDGFRGEPSTQHPSASSALQEPTGPGRRPQTPARRTSRPRATANRSVHARDTTRRPEILVQHEVPSDEHTEGSAGVRFWRIRGSVELSKCMNQRARAGSDCSSCACARCCDLSCRASPARCGRNDAAS